MDDNRHPLGLRPGMTMEEAEECARKSLEEKINANMGTHGLIKVTHLTLQRESPGPGVQMLREFLESCRQIEKDMDAKIKKAMKRKKQGGKL